MQLQQPNFALFSLCGGEQRSAGLINVYHAQNGDSRVSVWVLHGWLGWMWVNQTDISTLEYMQSGVAGTDYGVCVVGR